MEKEFFSGLGIKIVTSCPEAIERANNKYKLLQHARIHVPNCLIPETYLAHSVPELTSRVLRLGYPKNKVIINYIDKHSR